MNTFLDFYKTVCARMEGNIDNWSTTQKGNRNIIVQDGYDHLLQMNRGGKRLRGTLAYLGYYIMCDNDLSEADALAECFELFQTAILVHDDIIDHAESRRGMETIHTAYFREFMERQNTSQDATLEAGASIALCLGDMGFYLAEERLINGYGKNLLLPPLLSYYHKMVLHTIEGELLDVQLSYMERCGMQYAQEFPIDSLIYDIYHLKTSYYTTIGPLCSGMLLGGASPSLLRQMEDVADDIGIAFQIQDDILGIYSDAQSLGKSIGSDISEYKQTLLYSFVKNLGNSAYEQLRQYYGKSDISDSELREVQDIFRTTGALTAAESRVTELFSSAHNKLNQIQGLPEGKRTLVHEFIEYLQTREK